MLYKITKQEEQKLPIYITSAKLKGTKLKMSSQSRKFEFSVFTIIYLNDHNFCCTRPILKKCFSDKFFSSSGNAIWLILLKYQEIDVQIQTFTDED